MPVKNHIIYLADDTVQSPPFMEPGDLLAHPSKESLRIKESSHPKHLEYKICISFLYLEMQVYVKQSNKDENVRRFAWSAISGELLKREKETVWDIIHGLPIINDKD